MFIVGGSSKERCDWSNWKVGILIAGCWRAYNEEECSQWEVNRKQSLLILLLKWLAEKFELSIFENIEY